MKRLADLELRYSGKVRDIYVLDEDLWLLVASDRLSAFDVVMAERVPHKGRVLTAMSAYWFSNLPEGVGSHLVSTDVIDVVSDAESAGLLGRSMICRTAEMLPIECIVRGYLSGSAWKEYRQTQTVHGQPIEAGLVESQQLAEPIFTPSIKAESGHDINISYAEAVNLIGTDAAEMARDISLRLYRSGVERAAQHGIVIADTKFELGYINGEMVVADEVMTPDSSRFWPADDCEPGTTPPSFDKQPVRDFLETLDWDKSPPPPPMPEAVIAATQQRYIDAYERITGLSFADWPGAQSEIEYHTPQRKPTL